MPGAIYDQTPLKKEKGIFVFKSEPRHSNDLIVKDNSPSSATYDILGGHGLYSVKEVRNLERA
jgi:hypothetical protein